MICALAATEQFPTRAALFQGIGKDFGSMINANGIRTQ